MNHLTSKSPPIRQLFVAIAIIILLTVTVSASPPHPDLIKQVNEGLAQAPYFMKNIEAMRAKGIGGQSCSMNPLQPHAAKSSTLSPAVSEFRILAILVEFSDNISSVQTSFFDSLVFGTDGISVRDYYNETSYGQIDLVTLNLPSQMGWMSAPQTYAYYVDGQNGTGSYPNNSQRMVEDLVDLLDPFVDFSVYDNDGNSSVDIMLVIHAGTGAELSGDNDDFWSHKWSINPRWVDGVYVYDYTVQPEYWTNPGDMTIGVYAHELGHGFGLPDLYDTDYTSKGIGKWCVMSYGSWLGPNNRGGRPAHFCAWSKFKMGVLEPTNVTSNITSRSIADVENNAEAYRLWNTGEASDEYFLVENRQKTGYDQYLPGSGLLIWHIDDNMNTNQKEWLPGQSSSSHLLVALEQSDGLYDLEDNADAGDAGDPWPGTYHVTSFDALSDPGSNTYDGSGSMVSVKNISASSMTMTADLLVGMSSGSEEEEEEEETEPVLPDGIDLAQNYPNPFNPVTTIEFSTENPGHGQIEVYDITGRKVATLLDEHIASGNYQTQWDSTDESGHSLASGVYFYRLQIGAEQQVRKMLLLR